MSVEYRVCWTASTNISFRGCSDWIPWEGDDDHELALTDGSGGLIEGLEIALEASGFEWWVETQEATA